MSYYELSHKGDGTYFLELGSNRCDACSKVKHRLIIFNFCGKNQKLCIPCRIKKYGKEHIMYLYKHNKKHFDHFEIMAELI